MGGALHRTRRSFRVLCLPRRGGGWVVREGFPEEVAFAQRFERNEAGPGQVELVTGRVRWWKEQHVQRLRGKSQCVL